MRFLIQVRTIKTCRRCGVPWNVPISKDLRSLSRYHKRISKYTRIVQNFDADAIQNYSISLRNGKRQGAI